MSTTSGGASGLTRRTALIGGAAVLGASAAGVGVAIGVRAELGQQSSDTDAHGEHQAGIARPATPQKSGLISVFDFVEAPSASTVRESLRVLSAAITACTSSTEFDPLVTPDGPADLTVTIGIGPRVVAAIDPALPGATPLPSFASDELIGESDNGGDLLVAVYATDPDVLQAVTRRVARDLANVLPRWQQAGQRGVGEGTIVRNPLGHKDGIIVPRGAEELAENVWIGGGVLAGGTMCVIRRLRLRVDSFRSEPVATQEAIIGRHKIDGSPLSGGGPDAEVDVRAKTASGEFVIPARAHVRAAHPSFTGSALMLRRGYAYDNGVVVLPDGTSVADEGLLFICFQHDLDTFIKTQRRIDEVDDLRQYMTTTASASFLVLPGFSATQPLGTALFA